MAIGKDAIMPKIPPKIPPAKTAEITTIGCTLFVFPYTSGLITYPSKADKTTKTISVRINKDGEKANAVIAAITLLIIPPK